MPKIRRKNEHCLNCGLSFQADENYCPRCGQENNLKIKSFRYFILDFWNDMVQIDNRLIRSIKPFLFQPGRLTNEYLTGKQVTYIAPIRLYLTFSFLYFFLVSYEVGKTNKAGKQDEFSLIRVNVASSRQEDSLKLIQYKKTLTEAIKHKKLKDSIKIAQKIKNILILDSTWAKKDSSLQVFLPKGKTKLSGGFGLSGQQWHKVLHLAKNTQLSEAAIADSVKVSGKFWENLIVQQTIRLNRSTNVEIINYLIEKIPLTMFLVLPVFALLLKLVYIRTKRMYIEHLIFTLHIHSFYFFILTVAMLVLDFYSEANFSFYFIFITVTILLIYTFKSFRKVYRQNRFKTTLKVFLLALIYSIVLCVGLTVVLAVSLLWF